MMPANGPLTQDDRVSREDGKVGVEFLWTGVSIVAFFFFPSKSANLRRGSEARQQ